MKLLVVDWEDVSKQTNDEFDENKDLDSRLTPMKTVGFQYKETEKTLLLVQEFWTTKETPRDWVAIPKAQIRKITTFVEG
jgi:hypothetical protein